MSAHTAIVEWDRQGGPFLDRKYSRAHQWKFDGGLEVPGSSAPDSVRPPLSDPAAVDPEEAFVASLSSCHMLWFLALAARGGFVVDRYRDHAEGYLTKREDGKMWMSRVVLAPVVEFSGEKRPDDGAVNDLHHRAHEECYIANSVKSAFEMRGRWIYQAT